MIFFWRCLILAGALILVNRACAQNFPPGYYPKDEELALEASEEGKKALLAQLELVAKGLYPPSDGRPHVYQEFLVERAGNSADRVFAPVLRRIIDANLDKPRSGPMQEAFQGLQKLNEPKETFLKYASQYYPNLKVTNYAIQALAADPYDPDTLILLEKLEKDVNARKVEMRATLSWALFARSQAEQFDSKSTLEDKIKFLLPLSYQEYGSASAVWAHRKLGELSERYPEQVAREILKLRMAKSESLEERFGFKVTYKMVRDTLRKFLSEESAMMLQELERGKSIEPLVTEHERKLSEGKSEADTAFDSNKQGGVSGPGTASVKNNSFQGSGWGRILTLIFVAGAILSGIVFLKRKSISAKKGF